MVTLKIKEARSLSEKICGLMFVSKPYNFSFETRYGIHTFFLKFPIDVLILDQENIVVSYKEHILPYRFFFWYPRYRKVIELPAGTIAKKKITIRTKCVLER